MRMTLNTNMEMVGLREPYKATYKVSYKIPPYLAGLQALVRYSCCVKIQTLCQQIIIFTFSRLDAQKDLFQRRMLKIPFTS